MKRLCHLCLIVLLSQYLVGCAAFYSGEISKRDYGKVDALYSTAETAYSSGNLELAETKIKEALSIDPSDNRSIYRMATIKFKKGEIDDAAQLFLLVIEKDPRHARAHYNLATIRLIQAENHFKYFTATTDPKADVQAIAKLLSAFDDFAESSQNKSDPAVQSGLSDPKVPDNDLVSP